MMSGEPMVRVLSVRCPVHGERRRIRHNEDGSWLEFPYVETAAEARNDAATSNCGDCEAEGRPEPPGLLFETEPADDP